MQRLVNSASGQGCRYLYRGVLVIQPFYAQSNSRKSYERFKSDWSTFISNKNNDNIATSDKNRNIRTEKLKCGTLLF